MAQGYYTLEEAAQLLGMSVDELKQIARKGEIRSFQDRGSWRFRVQDIQEMARRRGMGSAPDLVLGDALQPKPGDAGGPKSMPPKSSSPKSKLGKSKLAKSPEAEVFDFSLEVEDDEQTGIGREVLGGASPSGKGKSSKRKLPHTPQPGSDSDVRLVGDDNDFNLEVDSDVKMVDTPKPGTRPSKLSPPTGKTNLGGAPPRPSKLGPTPSKLGRSPSKLGPASSKSGSTPSKLGTQGGRPSKLDQPRRTGMTGQQPLDSGVRLVPMDSDSDVRIVPPDESNEVGLGRQLPPSATDSDIRLELDTGPQRPDRDSEGMRTEEISLDNLDDELRKHEAAHGQSQPQAKMRPATPPPQPQFPSTSPFELSEPDIGLPDEKSAPAPALPRDDSSDFDLTPAGESSSPLESGSDDFRLELPDEDVALGAAPAPGDLKGPASGISLEHPMDSGISLEQGGGGSDEIEFELTLDGGDATPKPTSSASVASAPPQSSEFELTLDADEPKGEASSDSSEFELTLDAEDEPKVAGESDSDSSSEFELTLDEGDASGAGSAAEAGSDSEFELTLDVDDSGGQLSLADDSGSGSDSDSDSDSEFELTLDSAAGADQEEGDEEKPRSKQERDIFETDYDVPALEDESGSEAVALDDADTDLESSDFDIALEESDGSEEEDSESQVVALDEEEETDDGAATVAAKSRRGKVGKPDPDFEEEPGFGELDAQEGGEGEVEEEEEREPTLVQTEAVAARWGVLPVVFLLPCVVVMLVVGIMAFELVQGTNGYKQPGLLTKAISGIVPGLKN